MPPSPAPAGTISRWPMPTFRFTVEYDGSGFHGWQRQQSHRSVQGELERALRLVCQQDVAVAGAGRTDAGVHATGQVGSARIEDPSILGKVRSTPGDQLVWRLNRVLPDDVVVKDGRIVPDEFHARHSARRRRYRYRIRFSRSALERKRVWFVSHALDLERMESLLAMVRQHRDFRAFTRMGLDLPSYVVDFERLEVEAVDDGVDLVAWAPRFLHNMVRIMAGTLVDVGRNQLSVSTVERGLKERDRRLVGRTAPAHGLCLEGVDYDRVENGRIEGP